MNKQYMLNKCGKITSTVEAIRLIVDEYADNIDEVGVSEPLDRVLEAIHDELYRTYEVINVPMIRGTKQ